MGIFDRLGAVTPNTRKKAEKVAAVADAAGHGPWHLWGIGQFPEHNSLRALDFMIRTKEDGQFIRDYLWENRAALDVRHVIWDRHITSTTNQPGVVRHMGDRGNSTQNHEDHVHVLFLPTDRYTDPDKAPARPRVSVPRIRRTLYWNRTKTLTGNDVKRWQREMNRVFPSYSALRVDGHFGPACERVVREFQRRARIRVDLRFGPTSRAEARKRGCRF